MSAQPVPLSEAALQLNRAPSTLRKWIADGAPCARLGESGRGKGALVIVEDLRRWSAAKEIAPVQSQLGLDALAAMLRDYHRAGDHRLVAMRDDAARLLYAAFFEYVAARLGVDGAELFPNRSDE